MKERHLILLGLVALVVIGFAAWNFWSRRNEEKARMRRTSTGPSGQRAADQKPLTKQEIRIKKQAARLASKGRVLQAAQMLEQAGLYRDSIDYLENARLFDEAARVLIRLQRPGRAGVLYSRNGLFGPAAQCFLQAGDSLNAAKCFREIGKHHEAADLFVKAAHFGEAAECLEKSGLLIEAARNWMKVQKLPNAIQCWNSIGRDPAQLSVFKPSHEELEAMFHALKADAGLSGILKILAKSSEAASYILTLLSDNSFQTAKEIFGQTAQHVSGSLLGTINVQSPAAGLLVNLYQDSGQYRNAAILLEQMEKFEEAADCFSKSGDSERARYCVSRANKKNGKPAANMSSTQDGAPSLSSSIPKASFFIDASALNNPAPAIASVSPSTVTPPAAPASISALPNKVLNMRPEPATQPLSKLPLTNDETILLNRTWLFQQINESEVELLVARFSAVEYTAGHRVQSGSPNSFLVMVIDGEFHSSQRDSSLDGWLSPESGLGDQPPVEWVVTSEKARAIVIGSADFSAILAKDSDLTRQVYINLTQKLFSISRNSLYSKAV